MPPFNLRTRNKSTFRETKEREKPVSMEESESVGFNKRRAEGRDKSDKPKTLQLKVRKLNPINTICYVQILGTGMDTQDTSPSVLLFFDKQRFIFNAGEGLQRFCTEHKIKLSKIDHIFLSRVCSETAGGLPGLLLTLAGMGEEGMSVNVWGPSDLKYLVDAMKSFIPNAAMVHSHSFGTGPSDGLVPSPESFDPIVIVDDEVVKLSAILLQPNCSEERRNQYLRPHKEHSEALKPGDISVIYVCELPEIKGKFDPAKAAALGLRPGPKYRELQLGNSVRSDHQNIMVHPSDVMGPSLPGPVVILVDCPTEFHLQQLISLQSFHRYYANSLEKTVNCMIHLTPASVASTSDYHNWMGKFGEVQHIMAGHEMKNVEVPILKASARIAARLNYLCPQFFPAPGFGSLRHNHVKDHRASNEDPVSKLFKNHSAENLLKFNLRPYSQLGLDKSCIPSTTPHSGIINDLLSEIPEIVDAAKEVSNFWNRPTHSEEEQSLTKNNKWMIEEPWLNPNGNDLPSCLENVTREDMEIVLLGTGSSQPSKYRNVSSIFINIFAKGSLLLDCGEGTLAQLKRRFGIEGADKAVKGLKFVWISHIHADHHTGLARILALRRDLLKGIPHDPLLVIGPRQLKRYLDAYRRLEELDMLFLDCRHTTQSSLDAFENNDESKSPDNNVGKNLISKGSKMQSYLSRPSSLSVDSEVINNILKKLKEVLNEACLEALISFPVVHCPQAYGVVLKAAERFNSMGKVIPGWKLVYSGDTRPCLELVEASRGATVLIHEATFEDGMAEEAIARNHSTTKEAIEVGESADAYRIILTHFSQRYPKIPVFDETHMHNTSIGFDMMSVNLADLPVLPKVLPYLKLLFRNEMIVDESDDVRFSASQAI